MFLLNTRNTTCKKHPFTNVEWKDSSKLRVPFLGRHRDSSAFKQEELKMNLTHTCKQIFWIIIWYFF